MNVRWIILGAAGVAAAVVVALVLHRPAEHKDGTPEGPPLNVLLITLDTTRADRLGCYGYTKAATPTLDALAANGTRYSQAFTHVPLTLPSHATILTGLHPPEHGLHDNGREKLGPDPVTLAERLRGRSYRTGAFVASFVLDHEFGLDRGFDVYDDTMTAGTGTENTFDQENRADVMTGRALAWLEQNTAQPFFCWVHYYDPHQPYAPPEPYKSQFEDPYDGEIAFMDAQIRPIIEFLERTGQRSRTLIIACGDHGEAFGEHQEEGHGALVYEPTMRVPVIVNLPGRVPAGKVVDRVVGLVDVAATVLDALGWPPAEEMHGHSLLAEGVPSNRASYGESEFLFNSHGWAPLHSLTTAHWRYIECPKPELYDRTTDPLESKNVVEEKTAVAAEMKGELAALRSVLEKGRAAAVELDPHALAVLKQLGYLGGGSIGPRPRTTTQPAYMRDPKSMMAVLNACRNAKEMVTKGQHREAILLLEPVLRQSPESAEIHSILAEAYVALSEYAEAKPHVEACLGFDKDNRTMLATLAEILVETKKYEEAVRRSQQALRLPVDPREPEMKPGLSKITVKLRVNLGVALLEQKKGEEAVEQFALVLKEAPEYVEANNNIANAYVTLGRDADAVRHYRAALEADPKVYNAALNLGSALCRLKDYAGALDAWRAALNRRPDDAALMQSIAWQLATCPEAGCRDGREAVRLGEALCKQTNWSNVQALDTYAAALAESGEFTKAVEMARNAVETARLYPGAAAFAAEIEKRLALYRAGKAYHHP